MVADDALDEREAAGGQHGLLERVAVGQLPQQRTRRPRHGRAAALPLAQHLHSSTGMLVAHGPRGAGQRAPACGMSIICALARTMLAGNKLILQ